MVKLNDTSKGVLGEASEKIGNYQESTGGGTPLEKGEKLKDHPEARRVMQPRDENGQFTYNSANGKGLKYGPSRGTTVPPFLRGIKLTYCQPGTKLKIDGQDGIKIKIMTIDMTVEEMVNACKYYIESEEGFAGMGEGSSITKKGRKSKDEINAKAGQAGYIDPQKTSQKTQDEIKNAKAKYAAKNSAREVNPMIGNYQVIDDTLNPDGSTTRNTPARYWERNKNRQPNYQSQNQAQAQPQPQAQAQPQNTPVTPSGAPAPQAPQAPQAPTSGSIKAGLANIFQKLSGNGNNNNQQANANKFSGLNSSAFSNLFKKQQ